METMKFELKAASDEGSGTFEGIMSAPVLDRDDEVVDSKAFEPLPEHITIDIDHGLTVEKTVGSGVPYYDVNGLLKVKGTFASTPLGQMTRTLVKEGHIRHMSVAFRGAVREVDEVDGKQHVRKGELINCTITGIPSNTATALVAKVGARNSAKDAERIQNTHDHMVELGATCGEKHVHDFSTGGIIHDTRGRTILVGDKGPELIVPDKRTHIMEIDGHKIAQAVIDESNRRGGLPIVIRPAADFTKSADTEPPAAAAEESAAAPGAEVDVARALARLTLARAALALE